MRNVVCNVIFSLELFLCFFFPFSFVIFDHHYEKNELYGILFDNKELMACAYPTCNYSLKSMLFHIEL